MTQTEETQSLHTLLEDIKLAYLKMDVFPDESELRYFYRTVEKKVEEYEYLLIKLEEKKL